MSAIQILTLALAIWVCIILAVRLVVLPKLRRAPPGGNPTLGLLWYGARIYCRLFHRARYKGQEDLRHQADPGGLIVVSNHTSGVDPLLIQAACHFHIRWMMASDMMIPELDWLWTSQNIIPVSRDGRDSNAAREAIRHVRSGGVVGIFPEGRIVTHGEVRTFHPGIGILAARTKAPVLLVWISGTPQTESMSRSFITPSRSQVVFAEFMHFKTDDPNQITQQLREKLSKVSGWPMNDDPLPTLRIVDRRPQASPCRDRAHQGPMRLTA